MNPPAVTPWIIDLAYQTGQSVDRIRQYAESGLTRQEVEVFARSAGTAGRQLPEYGVFCSVSNGPGARK